MNRAELILLILTSFVQLSYHGIWSWPWDSPDVEIEYINSTSFTAIAYFNYKKIDKIEKVEIILSGESPKTFSREFPWNYEFNGLEPCTEYQIFIKILPEDKTKSEYFDTKPIIIPSVKNIKYDKSTNLLSWEKPSHGLNCLSHYLIEYAGKTVWLNSEMFNITDVQGCSNLEIRITPVDRWNVNGDEAMEEIEIKVQEPVTLDLNFSKHERTNSIHISWNHPPRNSKCVEYYALRYEGQEKHTNLTKIKISDLESCRTYKFYFCIIMKYDTSARCIERSFTTEYAPPEILIGTMILNSSSVNISLEYQNPNCIQYVQYELNSTINSKQFKNGTMLNYYHAHKLQACTEYDLSIRSFNTDNNFGLPVNKRFKTGSVAINSVYNITFLVKDSILTWEPPKFGAECVKHYLIDVDGRSGKVPNELIDLTNFPGCSNFQIGITPMGENDLKGARNSKHIHTGFKATNPVQIVNADSHSPNDITIEWNLPTVNPNCVSLFAIRFNKNIVKTNLTFYTISNLESCKDYNVTICIIYDPFMTNGENGPCTEPKFVRTQSTASEIIVGSIYPESFSGVMSLEFINVNCIEKLEIGLVDEKPKHFYNFELPAHYYIDQLEPCTEYNLVFNLYNTNKNFDISTSKTFNTTSVPIHSVKNIKFNQQTNLLTWDRPTFGAQCITHYVIDFQNASKLINVESIDLGDLPGCSKFPIKITPLGTNNTIGASNETYIESGFKTPNQVEYIYTRSNIQNSIIVSWETPTRNLACLKNFIILYNNMTLKTVLNTYNIDNLEPCTEYSIRICIGMTNDVVGQCSQNIVKETKPAIAEITIGSIISQSYSGIVPLKYKNANCIAKVEMGFLGGKKVSFKKPYLPADYLVENLKPCTTYNFIVTGYSDYTNLPIGDQKPFTTTSVSITAVENIKFNQKTNELTWMRPTNGSECIKNYVIDDRIDKYTTPNESYDMSHLAGCSDYSVKVTSMQESGIKSDGRIINFQTGLKEPDNVHIKSINSYSPNSIRLIYNIPMKNQKCVKNYAIKYGTQIQYTNFTTYTAINLEPCTEYSFEVCIIMINNRLGPCTAPTQQITTKSDQPETTIGTMISESFLVNVSLEYKNLNCVKHIEVGLIDGVVASFNKPNLPKFYSVNTLKPCTSHILFVHTYSFHNNEIFSINKTFTTESVLIDPVENIQFNPSTDILKWSRPNIGADCIKNYVIDDGEKTNSINSEFYDLQYLPGCSKFPIHITPIGKTGEQGKTNMIDIQTGVKETDGVEIVYAESTSSDSITVMWKVPRTNPNCIKNYSIIYSEYRGAEYTNLTRYTINNLEPCTDYNIQVCVIMINNEIGLCTNYTQLVSTLLDVPKIIIDSLNYNSSFANISLAYINANCIWYFEIGLNDEVQDLHAKSNLPTFYDVSQLKPCSEYEFFINIFSTAKERISISKMFKTSSVRIPKVENIEFNENSGVIQWTQPDFGAECVRWYSVNSNGITNVTSSQSISLTHLPGCAKHRIVITPQGGNDLTGESVVQNIQTGFKEPDHISNMIASSNSPKSIRMTWNKPNQNPDCVRNYEIVYDEKTEVTNQTEYTINNLEPCFKYSVHVCIVMINNHPRACTGEFVINTAKGIPNRVQKLRYTNSVIAWESPSYASKCIKKYILAIYDVLGSQIISEELTTISLVLNSGLLTSCQYYSISVIPITFDDEKGDEGKLTFKTEPIKPGRPSAPELISKTATSIELESNYKNEHDLCSLKRATFKCLANDTNAVVHWGNVSLSQHEKKFSIAINDLKDLTNYTCTVRIKNENYSSEESHVREFETAEKKSGPPDFLISSIKSKSVSIAWKVPIKKIRLKYYHLQILKIGKNYAVPKSCINLPYVKSFRIKADVLSHEFINLEPYTNYSIEMAIENTAGIGLYSDPMGVITEPDIPHKVQQFQIDRIYSNQTVELKWELPCEINGEVNSIKGTFYESQPPNSSLISYEWELKSPINLLTTNYYKENRIKPEHKYNVTIGIEIKNFTGPMNETIIWFTSPAGIPTAYASNDWGSFTQQTYPRNNVKLIVTKNLFSSTKGKIRKFSFLISERHCQEDPMPTYMFFINKFDETNTRLPTWFDLQDIDCSGQYQTQEFPVQSGYDTNGFEFIIGNQVCDEKIKYVGYCNGPLKSGTEYAVIARVYTTIGYAETNPIYFTTESNFPTAIVIIFIFTIICGLVVGFGIMRFKSRKLDEQPVYQEPHIENIELTPPRTSTYSHNFKIDLDVILDEFQSINDLHLGNLTMHAAQNHKPMNRYANILPYDLNRVQLIPNSYSPTDYVNASFIDGYTGPREYIASQGPIPETCYDFWNMIIETKCHRIVMLTKLFENRISKCAQYYPDPNDELQFFDINIFNVRELTSNLYTKRELLIRKSTTERLIVQYHFQNWPDHGCPENELDLINLIQMVRTENNIVALDAPIVIHCSAGVGRTGTLIALDILMQQVANDKKLNVCETVKNLRYQRVKMVQTLAQYQFLYKSVARYIHRKSSNSKH